MLPHKWSIWRAWPFREHYESAIIVHRKIKMVSVYSSIDQCTGFPRMTKIKSFSTSCTWIGSYVFWKICSGWKCRRTELAGKFRWGRMHSLAVYGQRIPRRKLTTASVNATLAYLIARRLHRIWGGWYWWIVEKVPDWNSIVLLHWSIFQVSQIVSAKVNTSWSDGRRSDLPLSEMRDLLNSR